MPTDPAPSLHTVQAAALHALLDAYPAPLTVDELVRLIANPPERWPPLHVHDALDALTGAGPVHRWESFVLPTRSTVACSLLLDR